MHIAKKTFPAKIDTLYDVFSFIGDMLEHYGCAVKIKTAVCVAIEEIFVNIANYANGDGEGNMTLGIGFDEASRAISWRITDKGTSFYPLKKTNPDITLPAVECEIGRLGIFIDKNTMDEINYAYENGKNILISV